MRQHAANWLELAEKIEHYRRDVLDATEMASLQGKQQSLRNLMREKADASRLKLGIEQLESVLQKTGGAFYPKRSAVEYVEFFLVAAIVILGVRAFFFQPFKIPTNSMWPSYNGMTGEVFKDKDSEPGFIGNALRFVTQLATPKRINSPYAGELKVHVVAVGDGRSYLPFQTVSGRKWLVIPTQLREYNLYVGDRPVTVQVPGDFDFDTVIRNAYFNGAERIPLPTRFPIGGQGGLVSTGKKVNSGDRILAFDVLTGDQLFVDRLSYHFVKPSVGDGFVFRTQHLTDLHPMMRGPKDQYYIKRLVGTPGDVIEIAEPVLLRNGAPITGSKAFEKNATQADNYPGYRNEARMQPGVKFTVPKDSYYAFGDNSASSLDGRYWGTIPAKDVVGRPLFIYYPFTRRWGPAP